MQGKRVIVADDDQFQLTVLKGLYGALKVDAVTVDNGKKALETYQQSQNFVHILMDLQMPVMNGFASTEQIRAFEKSKNLKPIPIYGLSGDQDEKTKKACTTSGMNGLLAKPVKKDVLEKYI